MNDLIARLENTDKDSRELDLAIANTEATQPWEWLDKRFGTVTQNLYGKGAVGNPVCTLERFTYDINDALQLVPGGFRWYVADSDDRSDGKPVAAVYQTDDMLRTGRIPRSVGSTPAIALCIAALKARTLAHVNDEQRGGA